MAAERSYYMMEKGGFADTQCEEYLRINAATIQTWLDFSNKHGGEEMYGGNDLNGLQFARPNVPLGWNNVKLPGGVYKPARIKVCMEAYLEFKALGSVISGMKLSTMLKVGLVCTGMSIAMPAFETVGEHRVLSLAKGSDVPDGATLMKNSAYWALVEENEKD